MKKLIYLATPYSHPDKTKVRQRYMEACTLAGDLFRHGHMVHSPIAHNHGVVEMCGFPHDYDFWKDYCRLMLSKCDILLIAKMEGYGLSIGVAAEKIIAEKLGIPVVYATPTEIKDNTWRHNA